jgi:hypothetical protein
VALHKSHCAWFDDVEWPVPVLQFFCWLSSARYWHISSAHRCLLIFLVVK